MENNEEKKRLKRNTEAKGDGCGSREGVREFMVPGLIVPAHVRVHSWGNRGKWGADVLYQTLRPALQWIHYDALPCCTLAPNIKTFYLSHPLSYRPPSFLLTHTQT